MKNHTKKESNQKIKVIGSILMFIVKYMLLPACLFDLLEGITEFMIKNGNIAQLPDLIRGLYYPLLLLLIVYKLAEVMYSNVQSVQSVDGDAKPFTAVLVDEAKIEKTLAAHEAGHWMMCELYGIPVNKISIKNGTTELSEEFVSADCYDREYIEGFVKMLYGGIVAEKMLLGNVDLAQDIYSNSSDLKRSEELIKRYVIATDTDIELTPSFHSPETVRKITDMSKKLRQETAARLMEHKDKLQEKYERLLKEKEITL